MAFITSGRIDYALCLVVIYKLPTTNLSVMKSQKIDLCEYRLNVVELVSYLQPSHLSQHHFQDWSYNYKPLSDDMFLEEVLSPPLAKPRHPNILTTLSCFSSSI